MNGGRPQTVGVAVVGTGAMGMNHVRVYRNLGARVVAAVDPDPARRAACTQRFGVEARSDLADVLEDPEVEALSIAAPTAAHHAVARDALLAGKHVLVEKPLAGTLEQAEELTRLADEAGLVLAVGHVERHNPVVRMTRELLDGGVCGELISLSARRVGGINTRIQDVGVILDLAVHDIDVLRHVTGSEVASVHAVAGSAPGKHENRAHLTLEFHDGVFGSIDVNWLSPIKVRTLNATCTKGYLELDYIQQSIRRSTSHCIDAGNEDLYRVPREYESHLVSIQNQEPLANELTDFLDAVRTGHAPLVRGEDGLAALRVAHAALESVRERRRVTLDE